MKKITITNGSVIEMPGQQPEWKLEVEGVALPEVLHTLLFICTDIVKRMREAEAQHRAVQAANAAIARAAEADKGE